MKNIHNHNFFSRDLCLQKRDAVQSGRNVIYHLNNFTASIIRTDKDK